MNCNIIKRGNSYMIKYHNDMNIVRFRNFGQRELNIFFSICSVMANKSLDTVILSFEDIKKITATAFSSNDELVEYIKSTNEKFQSLNGAFYKGSKYIQFVLFPTFETDEKERTLKVSVNKEFAYILNEITKNFTIFELQEFNTLKSTYSKHLFRLLKQWKSTGHFKIEMDEFKRLLDVSENYRMTDINKRVLIPVIKELNPYFTGLKLTKIKEGRNIKFLEFTFQVQKNELNKSEGFEQDKIVCPVCKKPLQHIKTLEGIEFLGHKNFKTSNCQMTFSSIDEVKAMRERQTHYQKMVVDMENQLEAEEKKRGEIDIESLDFYKEHLAKKEKKTKKD